MSLTHITDNQREALTLVDLVQRFVSYADIYSEEALQMAIAHLSLPRSRGDTAAENEVIDACIAFMRKCLEDDETASPVTTPSDGLGFYTASYDNGGELEVTFYATSQECDDALEALEARQRGIAVISYTGGRVA